MVPFNYLVAKGTAEASSLSQSHILSKFIAGGTNLIDLMKENISRPDTLIDVNKIQGIGQIEELRDGSLRIGALAKNADTAYHAIVAKKYPLLSQAILAGASPQLRNMASNGGNLLQRTRCYYFYDVATPCNKRDPGSGCSALGGYNRIHAILGASDNCIAVFPSDMCVALAALSASLNISGINGDRTLDFADFHRLPGDTPELDNNLQPGELITSIDLPPERFDSHYSYLKLRDRTSYAFALVSVATALKIENGLIKDARIALGGVAHKPWRNSEAEGYLKDNQPNAQNFAIAADIILKEAKGYEHNTFKIELAKRAIVRNGLKAVNQSQV
ncbi:FAD binding domain-containing protein [Daejeonella lutea]|uniref:Xanthine dehydrogenase YagS FAD-binding subunit n=1 Tax=Daejeonella lutea TaxID=572036 RepID=A0A1T5BAC0_9SPHI|nr:xanthine dehydrogenase family protein subunit M [Daejeonella lutea]SKB44196.1 xanthine dehydrogenase YagS FAD-binding subunit [Daejeonella lutea]